LLAPKKADYVIDELNAPREVVAKLGID